MYTQEEIVNEILSLPKKRERKTVDQRSYLIGILIFKFKMTENKIGELCGITRNKVHHCKVLFSTLYGHDPFFQNNIKNLVEKYYFEYDATSFVKPPKTKVITLALDIKMYKKLKAFGNLKGDVDVRTTIKNILEKSLILIS